MDELLSPNPDPNAGSTPVPPASSSAAVPEAAPIMEVQATPVAVPEPMAEAVPAVMTPTEPMIAAVPAQEPMPAATPAATPAPEVMPVAAPAIQPVVEMSSAAPVAAVKMPYDWYAALAFLPPFLFLISLWKDGEKASVQRGAQYGMIFFFVYVAMDLLVRALLFVSPLSLWLVIGLLYVAVRLAFFGVIVYSSWRALNGNIWTIPVLGDLSARLPVTAWFKQVQAMLKKPASPSTPSSL